MAPVGLAITWNPRGALAGRGFGIGGRSGSSRVRKVTGVIVMLVSPPSNSSSHDAPARDRTVCMEPMSTPS